VDGPKHKSLSHSLVAWGASIAAGFLRNSRGRIVGIVFLVVCLAALLRMRRQKQR
jgi:hypothetical protein